MPRAVFYVERELSSEGSQGAGLGRAAAVMSARVERRTVSRIAGGCAALDGGGRARRRPAGAVAAPFSRAGSGGRTLAGCVARMAASSGRGRLRGWEAWCNSIFEVSSLSAGSTGSLLWAAAAAGRAYRRKDPYD